MLDSRVILEAVGGEIFAISRALKATMRHFGNQRNMGVDPDAAEVKGLCHAHRGSVVGGPHA